MHITPIILNFSAVHCRAAEVGQAMGMGSLHLAEICQRQQKRAGGGLQRGSTGGNFWSSPTFGKTEARSHIHEVMHTDHQSYNTIWLLVSFHSMVHQNKFSCRCCFLYKFDASLHSFSNFMILTFNNLNLTMAMVHIQHLFLTCCECISFRYFAEKQNIQFLTLVPGAKK